MGRIGLIGENSVEYLSIVLDIWNTGNCVVLLDWQIPLQVAVEMMRESAVSICYIDSRLLPKTKDLQQTNITFVSYEAKNVTSLANECLYEKYQRRDSKDEAVVIFSSGTTGKAKGIILSHYAITSNAESILQYMELVKDDCIYTVRPFCHSSTFTGEFLVAMLSGCKLLVAPTIVPPRFILRNIIEYAVTVLCVNPLLLSMIAEEYKRNQSKNTSLKKIYTSGSILRQAVLDMAKKSIPDVEIYNVYGLTEAGPRVTAQRKDACSMNSVGKTITGVNIIITDENGNVCNRNEPGIIHVKTPSIFSGYISGIMKYKSCYEGWLNTGDIGYLDSNDELFVESRIDDVIIVNSHKIYPNTVENKILEVTNVCACHVLYVIYGDKEYYGCLYVSDTENSVTIAQKIKEFLLPYEIPKYFVKCDTLPYTKRGKLVKVEAEKIMLNHIKGKFRNI